MNKSVFASLLLALPLSLSAAPQSLNVPLPPPSPATPAVPPASTAAPAGFAQLDPQQQRQRRADYAARRALPEAERERIRQAAARFNALPADQQQRMRQQFRTGPGVPRRMAAGPAAGPGVPKLHGLFGFVPPEQRESALAVLRQLSPAQLAQLTLVAQRTPPQERDAVRSAFLAVPAAERDSWLKRQAGQ